MLAEKMPQYGNKALMLCSGTETPSRTSSSMFFTRGLENEPTVVAVEGRISKLMQRDDVCLGRTFEKSEAMQGELHSNCWHIDNLLSYKNGC